MINHISIGVRSIAAARKFYDATLNPLGYTRLSEDDSSLGYGKDAVVLWISASPRPVKPDAASGLHICFDAPTRGAVETFHAAGLAAGGMDNGSPGLRKDYGANYFAAFLVDPDGYRIEAYCGR